MFSVLECFDISCCASKVIYAMKLTTFYKALNAKSCRSTVK